MVVDILMTVILMFVMAYQVTGNLYHEVLGTIMLVLFITHNALNIKWYGNLFKGKYNVTRIVWTLINLAVLVSICITGYSGIAMSRNVYTFLNLSAGMASARELHLAGSYWSFVLMSCHLGLHWSMVTGMLGKGIRDRQMSWWILRIVAVLISVYGAIRFYQADIYSYMFLKNIFAYLDYEKAPVLVLLEHLAMMGSFVFVTYYLRKGLANFFAKKADRSKKGTGCLCVILAVCVFLLTILGLPGIQKDNDLGSWSGEGPAVENSSGLVQEDTEPVQDSTASVSENVVSAFTEIDDGFILITGGTFTIGSPETENWRNADETQHEVTVSDFYMSPFELTGEEYQSITGENPSMFTGDNLPVESVSWLDAVSFCNALSEQEGLNPVYTIEEERISWDRNANGYRLPTEAEWEYACRAGTTTPFNTETSISAEEANYYGHYPYEIEENYFSQDNLTTKPGEYRQTTVAVDSFSPNAWGFYNMHGNVSEWVWDIYGAYDASDSVNPTGMTSGNRRVYRGGGWNDFAKNMRSAYRATLEQDQGSFNIGIRLVRNAADEGLTTVTTTESVTETHGGNVLIAYFSWGGNTRGVAEEIERQTGADVFEITLETPYSTDYNTVLEQAQHDQNIQARPVISSHVENMEDYDVILLGYPNWWASIPMPIASFLEEYDFSGKTIIPFCSHGGGRFGQSITAISKLVPDCEIGEGLSIHYSGGSSLASDVTDWLETNGLN